MLQLIVAAVVTILVVLFAMANNQHVELNYIVGEPLRIRLIFLLACVFAAGMVTSYFYQMVSQMNRRRRRIRNEYERELE
jgi:uncharacterized integral membrane protein